MSLGKIQIRALLFSILLILAAVYWLATKAVS